MRIRDFTFWIAAAVVVVVALIGLQLSGRQPTRTLEQERTDMTQFCAQLGLHAAVWQEVDSDGSTNVYGRCV